MVPVAPIGESAPTPFERGLAVPREVVGGIEARHQRALSGPLDVIGTVRRKESAGIPALRRNVPIVTRPTEPEIQREPAPDGPLVGKVHGRGVNRG